MKNTCKSRVRITSFGILFLTITFSLLLATLNYNNNLAYLFLFVLLSLAIVVFVKGWLNVFHVQLYQFNIRPTFAHQQIRVLGSVTSRYRLPSFSLTVSIDINGVTSQASIHDIDQSTQFKTTVSPLHRGIYAVQKVVLASSYPLGLFQWSATLDLADVSAWVYPEPIDYALNPVQGSRPRVFQEHVDFDELVSWQKGDGYSGVCWKTYARTGKRMKKLFTQDNRNNENLFDWAQLTRLKDEEKLSQLCFWIVEKNKKGQAFGLRLPQQFIQRTSGTQHYQRCLMALASFKTDLDHAVKHA